MNKSFWEYENYNRFTLSTISFFQRVFSEQCIIQ